FRHPQQVSGFLPYPTSTVSVGISQSSDSIKCVGFFRSSGIFGRSGFSVWPTPPEFRTFPPATFFMSDP
ncbi:hypothetical protein KI387_000330, partial [Taxus chinensis]